MVRSSPLGIDDPESLTISDNEADIFVAGFALDKASWAVATTSGRDSDISGTTLAPITIDFPFSEVVLLEDFQEVKGQP
ncbi:hypothetical protein SLA2020_284620 [Shorea laevis]